MRPLFVIDCSGLLIVIRPALALNGNNKPHNINTVPFIFNPSMPLLTNHGYLVAFSRSDDYSNHNYNIHYHDNPYSGPSKRASETAKTMRNGDGKYIKGRGWVNNKDFSSRV